MPDAASDAPRPLGCAVVTVSDSRTEADDRSGNYLVESLQGAGHTVGQRCILPDDRARLQSQMAAWVAEPTVQVVIATGGTGLTGRDVTPEAAQALITKPIPGFGELFRWLSFEEIGPSTIQSRALAGLAGETLLFCLPGSSGGCKLAMERIILPQLDSRTRPCNLADLMPRFSEA
jgi:molybdenum cofactor biosynthesis protein B